jgi:hypothetical protein
MDASAMPHATPDRRFAQLNFIAVIPEFFGLKAPLLAAVGSGLLSIGCPPGWSRARPLTGIGRGLAQLKTKDFRQRNERPGKS